MKSAREILDQRLAAGEIDLDTHAQLLAATAWESRLVQPEVPTPAQATPAKPAAARPSPGELVFATIALAVLLYFVWKASPAIDYYSNPIFVRSLEDRGGIWWALAKLCANMRLMLLAATGLCVADAFIEGTPDDTRGAGTLVLAILWAVLGWYCNRQRNEFDSGVLLAYLAFSVITVLMILSTLGGILINLEKRREK